MAQNANLMGHNMLQQAPTHVAHARIRIGSSELELSSTRPRAAILASRAGPLVEIYLFVNHQFLCGFEQWHAR